MALILAASKKFTAYDRFYGNGPYRKILTKKELITTLGFTSRLPFHVIMTYIVCHINRATPTLPLSP